MPDRSAIATLALAALAACAASCAKEKPNQARAIADTTPLLAQDDVLTPVVRGGTNGLEVLWFVCRDADDSLASALAPYVQQPVDVPSDAHDSLKRNGLRLVRIPLDDFSSVRASLRPVGPTERTWLGWSLHWSEAFRARSLARNATVTIDSDPITLDAVGSRFLARAWGSPTTEGERVRVEFATQLLSASPMTSRFQPLADAQPVDLSEYELRRGELIEQLSFEAQLAPGFAYLLVPAAPDEDWVAIAEGGSSTVDPETQETFGFEFAETPRDLADLAIVFGPPAPAPQAIGQAILTSWDPFETRHEAAERTPLLKAIVAFVPRCETPARLLPSVQDVAQR